MYKKYEMELAGRTLRVDVDRVAKQANGAVLMHYGDTTVLCTATASEKPREGIDFFPLSVEYNERLYSVGKIPGGFNKREGKASENAILTCRVIDRPMRPLFPKDYRNDVTLENLVLSVDQDCSPELTAMLGAAIATTISDIPFDGPISSTQVGLVDGELVFNPTAAQREVSDTCADSCFHQRKGDHDRGGRTAKCRRQQMIDAIFAAHELNQKVIAFIDTIVAECGKPKHAYESCAVPEELFEAIKEIVPPAEMEEAVFTDEKQVREENIRQITEKLDRGFRREGRVAGSAGRGGIPVSEEDGAQDDPEGSQASGRQSHRPDPSAGSGSRPDPAEFTVPLCLPVDRPRSAPLTTLAPLSEAQRLDGLDEAETSKRYMHHYNFPSYSVGETRPSRGPGRREIGHGALAERALLPVLPSESEFPYAIRTVSETFESNGSTSQASVCASSMSLMAAGVPIKTAVAGISSRSGDRRDRR